MLQRYNLAIKRKQKIYMERTDKRMREKGR